jgi:hypothetical protein
MQWNEEPHAHWSVSIRELLLLLQRLRPTGPRPTSA